MTLSDELRRWHREAERLTQASCQSPSEATATYMADLLAAADRLDDLEAGREIEQEMLRNAATVIHALTAELERTRQAWVDGDDPLCDDVCMVACKGPCGVTS